MKKIAKYVIFWLTAIIFALFVLSFSIAVPIFVRGIYYAHITPLEIEETADATREEIVSAYDELLDYLIGKGDFGCGKFSCSEDAVSHFEDCKKLFILDYTVCIITAVVLVAREITVRAGKRKRKKIFGFGPTFYGILLALLPIAFFGIFILADENAAFTFFHTLLFPGKTNWYFSPIYDSVINILPMEFFIDCGIVIGIFVAAFSVVTVAVNIHCRNKKR